MTVVLDTTAVIDLLRGRPGVIERLEALRRLGQVPYITAITAEEVHRGLRPGEERKTAHVLTSFQVAPLGIVEGMLAGLWRRTFAERGVTLEQPDCLIAAAAVGVGAAVATGNPKDFPMEGVSVQHWPVGA